MASPGLAFSPSRPFSPIPGKTTLRPVDTQLLLREADRCVKCGLCLPHCPTYGLTRNEGDSPRGRISLVQARCSGELDDAALERHLERCLCCRACEAACPSGVRYGRIIDGARAIRPASSGIGQRTLLAGLRHPGLAALGHRLVHLYQRLGLHRLFRKQGSSRFRRLNQLLPRLPAPARWRTLYPVDRPRRRVGLFTGCIGRVTDRSGLEAAILVLNRLGIEVLVPPDQVCCGALHQHHGDPQGAARLAAINREAFAAEKLDSIVYLASGCGAQLAAYPQLEVQLAAPVEEICHYLSRRGLIEELAFTPLRRRLALHTPCSLRYPLKGGEAVKRLLQRIPDSKLFTLPEEGCCGAAGSYLLTQPQLADSLRETVLNGLPQEEGEILLTSNTGCAMHLAAGLRQAGRNVEVLHPIELIARQLERPAHP